MSASASVSFNFSPPRLKQVETNKHIIKQQEKEKKEATKRFTVSHTRMGHRFNRINTDKYFMGFYILFITGCTLVTVSTPRISGYNGLKVRVEPGFQWAMLAINNYANTCNVKVKLFLFSRVFVYIHNNLFLNIGL